MVTRTLALLFVLGTTLIFGVADQALAKAPSEQYREHSEELFYFFSEAAFDSFSCNMQVDALDLLVKSLEEQFKAAKVPVTIQENRGDFKVSFERKKDTSSFVEPSLKLSLNKDAELSDPESTKAGIVQVEAGYKGVVIGAVQVVRGVFDEFTSSRFAKYAKVEFKKSAKGYDASFTKDGAQIQESFDGQVRRMTFSAQGQTITSKSTYQARGKAGLLFSSAELVPGPGMRITISIDYQEVKGVLLPKDIAVLSRQEMGGQVAENLVKVQLQRCKVRR